MLAVLLRYLLLFSARLAGALRRLLRRKLVFSLILLGGIAAGVFAADQFRLWLVGADAGSEPAGLVPWLTAWNVLSLWAFALVAWWVLELRQQLVIDSFEDFSGGEAQTFAKSFGVMLVRELANLNALFNEFDEGRQIQATPDPLVPLDATFHVESISQFLNQAVSSESSFSLGPLKIPVGVIAGLIGRMAQGPRLSGQVHRFGTREIVTAQLVGRLGNRIWRVERIVESDDALDDSPARIAHRLACMMFAEMVLGNSVDFRALEAFVKSLNAYRQSLYSPRGQRLHLQEAERALLVSIDRDAGFDLAYYNLGVVYTELGRLEAAGKAFTTALQRNNRRWSYYYALARNYYDRGVQAEYAGVAIQQLLKALNHCDRSIRLARQGLATAQAINLKTLAQLKLANTQLDLNMLGEASRTARRAARWSWWALCGAEYSAASDQVLERIQKVTGICLLNLATILYQWANLVRLEQAQTAASNVKKTRIKIRLANYVHDVAVSKAIRSLRLGRHVTPWAAEIHQLLGRVLLEDGRDRRAIRSLRIAVRTNPTSLNPWGHLALAYARYDDEPNALVAFSRVLEDPSTVEDDSLTALSQAMKTLGKRLDDVELFWSEAKDPERLRRRARYFIWFMVRYMRLAYRLSGRRLNRHSYSGAFIVEGMKDPEPFKARFDAQREQYELKSERALSVLDVRKRVHSLREKAEEGVEPLTEMLQEQEDAGFEWEYGEVADQLSRLLMQLGRFTEAEQTIRAAIDRLSSTQASEIQRRGLYAMLARVLRRQGRSSEALEEAVRAVETDPVGAYERTELGWTYFDLAEYELARKSWEDAMVWNPNEPQLYHCLGLCLLTQMSDCQDKAERAAKQKRATHYLENALDLYSRKDAERNNARFLLARSYSESGDYRAQVSELRALERAGYHRLFIKIHIADAYLGKHDLGEAENRFRTAATEIESMLAKKHTGANDALETPPGEEMPLGVALAFARLGIAASLSEREIHLDEARAQIAQARKAIGGLKDQGLRDNWSGHCDLFEGEILFRQQKIDEAVDMLESALASNPIAQGYCRLAQCFERKLELGVPDAESVPLARRALRYCEESHRVDWTDSFKEDLDCLRGQLAPFAKTDA